MIEEKIKISSQFSVVPQTIKGLMDIISAQGINPQTMFNIKLSIEEALTNAIKHGNKSNPDLFVTITVRISDTEVEITVVDEGQGFDYSQLKDPTVPENLTRTSGRGVYLIRNLMDRVEYFDCGRGLKMVKSLQGGKA